ncbi:MAG: tRNA-dependent cyclodipeptide synthase [Chitinophagaceae bacterium]|nr:tRNA-dependent cyclodipeptide synthase [Chitinophagaceae bacterium]
MKYNIAVEKVYPEISEVELFKNTDSILGVSLESPFFERSSLNDIVEWCSLNFENTNILIGDSLHKYSEAIATGAPLKEAERKSISKGDSLYARFEEAIMKIGKDSFTITRWKNIAQIIPL